MKHRLSKEVASCSEGGSWGKGLREGRTGIRNSSAETWRPDPWTLHCRLPTGRTVLLCPLLSGAPGRSGEQHTLEGQIRLTV